MAGAYIVDAVRTPVGRRGGGLAAAHPADLGAHVIRELLTRTGLDPQAVDDVVFGCVDSIGPQAGDIAIWLCALPGYDSDKRSGVQACPRPPVLVARWGRAVATDHSRREEPWTSAPSA